MRWFRSPGSTYIRSIAYELTKKDLLVAVECVDDQAEKLIDLSLKGERLCLRHCTRMELERRKEQLRPREEKTEEMPSLGFPVREARRRWRRVYIVDFV